MERETMGTKTERLVEIQRALYRRNSSEKLTADERREVEGIIRDLAAEAEGALYQLSSALALHVETASRLNLAVHIPDLGKGKAAASDIRQILTPNGDAFADD